MSTPTTPISDEHWKDALRAEYWTIIAAIMQSTGQREINLSQRELDRAKATVTQLDTIPYTEYGGGIVVRMYTYGPAIERFEREGV